MLKSCFDRGLMTVLLTLSGLACDSASAGACTTSPAIPGPGYTHTPIRNGYIIATPTGLRQGVGVAYADRYDNGQFRGIRPLRLTPTGWSEMGNLGERNGTTYAYVQAINGSGISVGWANYYIGTTSFGSRGVRWDAAGNAVRLADIGTDFFGNTSVTPRDINESGVIVGGANRYNASGQSIGVRAVRWDPQSTFAMILNPLNLSSTGTTYSGAYDINDAGVIVGYAQRWGPAIPPGGDDGGAPGSTGDKGQRAVRWSPGSTVATELGNLGLNVNGYTNSIATHVTQDGTAYGWAERYSADGRTSLGRRIVRWAPGSIVAEAFEAPELDAVGSAILDLLEVTESGIAVGAATIPSLGVGIERATWWDARTGRAFVLPDLPIALTESIATAVNASGVIGGRTSLALGGGRATIWTADGQVRDLATLVTLPTGWNSFSSVTTIGDDHWVLGSGEFDPDGPGGHIAYARLFTARLPAPHIIQQPVNAELCANAQGTVAVIAEAGLGYQWQVFDDVVGWRDIEDGPIPTDACATAANAASSTLSITLCSTSEPVRVRCLIANACMTIASMPVVIGLSEPGTCPTCPSCPADYDLDGGVTGADLADFFADFEAGEGCADVDGNGGVDGGDLGFFFNVFEAGGC